MAYRGQGQKVQKVMVQPINLIFRYLQNRSRIQVWLYEQVNMRIEGCIIGPCSLFFLEVLCWESSSKTFVPIVLITFMLLPDDNKCCGIVFI
uniref:Small nuclear ribonucleoprotein E n=1 Tax=Panthera leo TaxID=9689 RepID=A0A8C8W8V8_PANLE